MPLENYGGVNELIDFFFSTQIDNFDIGRSSYIIINKNLFKTPCNNGIEC